MHYLRPYPVEYFDGPCPPEHPSPSPVWGLVGFDLLTALTVGRGGTYEDLGDRMRYVRKWQGAADLPLLAFGFPYCAKSAHGVDSYGDYQPVVCTPKGSGP